MNNAYSFLQEIGKEEHYSFRYSICTLVSKKDEYFEMVASFLEAGFNPASCEYLYIDNTHGNSYDAFAGLNCFLRKARGKYIILCHQDVLLNFDKRDALEQRLAELDALDPQWGLCGNAGAAGPNYIVYRISYPGGLTQSKGKFPEKVHSLDENFILVKNEAMLALSNNLRGFHLYGTDICLQAAMRGYNAYVVDFHLTHKSRGNPDGQFRSIRRALIKKYNTLFRSRWIQTTNTSFYLSGSRAGRMAGNGLFLFFSRMWHGLKKRLK
ncbi:hypothetical protein EDD80_111112 [Anseongella ginsenosidimutans]|uniref:Acyl esterase n=1 Tax=Anseongella ginsenosidimutans TaxID=496056 RepID=A0A4R3KNS8_9SPHI|nr:hypothetical protein [Anseongella ginsenosidimutans]QEC51994.1 hypothetical protein FRZ59_06380 [Anseongella ginsenosidimutans]TCS85709.1 hypothetical protein EDD80_111112 [Anseongella ginsenosidimutans]